VIICPNPSCKTANTEGTETCQNCQSVLPHYYLWGVGDLVATLKPGTLVNQRYLLKRDRIFLDTKPGILPESLPDIPGFLQPYLHLSAYPLHVPRPYSVLRTPDKDYVLMLESSALSLGQQPEVPGQLPRLINRWKDAPPLRQLNWLWQIAQMWDGFSEEQVAATLLDSTLLRVDGSIVRLMELASPMPTVEGVDSSLVEGIVAGAMVPGTIDSSLVAQPTLVDLARSWQPLAESAHQAVRAFLGRLCESLERQQLNSEQLSEHLSQAITVCASDQQLTYDLSVHTDQGPTRKRNEDACFPESGTTTQYTSNAVKNAPQLLIVCDGIGGHQGGDVASKLAISTIQSNLAPVLAPESPVLTATELSLAIESAICAANDEISAQNDQAQRQARDRMGTTLVLALIRGAEVYIAHLGDSRGYRVSSRNCQQVTQDDDVASRQVRLGGSLYREVLVQPGSGSLIQALGMGSSQSLRPTVQRFVIDENCVFLLCSDGLSDSDRVEQFWQSELSPLVLGEAPFSAAGPRLVDLANKYNGHDNVTVGLLSAQVMRVSERIVPRDMATSGGAKSPTASDDAAVEGVAAGDTQPQKTRLGKGRPTTTLRSPAVSSPEMANVPSFAKTTTQSATDKADSNSKKSAGSGGWKKASLALLLLALVSGGLFAAFPGLRQRFLPASDPLTSEGEAALPSETTETDSSAVGGPPVTPPPLNIQDFIRIRPAAQTAPSAAGIPLLYPTPEIGVSPEPNDIAGTVPTGSVVQVMQKQTAEDGSDWVQVALCSIPSGESLSDVPAETDTPDGEDSAGASGLDSTLNVPESIDQPLILNPGSDGWILEASLGAIALPIEDVQPSQKGRCDS